MHPSEYGVMSRCERDHWWYSGLHSLVGEILSRKMSHLQCPMILDAGCGTGGFLQKNQPEFECLIGMEPSDNAYTFLMKSDVKNLVKADMLRIPFQAVSMDALVSMDVLCVFQGDEISCAIREIANTLKHDGYLILNLPAYTWMISGHDHFVGNKTRFTATSVLDELKRAGLIVEYAGYRNTILFPIVLVVRLASRLMSSLYKCQVEPVESDVKMPPEWINRILARILLFENGLICRGWRFCFGLSVFIVARKPDSNSDRLRVFVSENRNESHRKG